MGAMTMGRYETKDKVIIVIDDIVRVNRKVEVLPTQNKVVDLVEQTAIVILKNGSMVTIDPYEFVEFYEWLDSHNVSFPVEGLNTRGG